MFAVYLRLPLSHAQTEKNIMVVRGGVVAEERKEKCVWSGSVRHSISGRAGLGALFLATRMMHVHQFFRILRE